MFPLQVGGVAVLVLSLLALIVYAIVGGLVARDARAHTVTYPAVWGGAVFVAMLLGTLFVARQLLGALVAGLLVIGLYALVARG